MDSYYLDMQPKEFYSQNGNPNFDHPAAFDWELLSEHISKVSKQVNRLRLQSMIFPKMREVPKP